MGPYFESLVRRSDESGGYRRRRRAPRALAGPALALALLLSPALARADDEGSLLDLPGVFSRVSFAEGPASWISMRPIGHFASPGQSAAEQAAVSSSASTPASRWRSPRAGSRQDAWAFGGRAGYEFATAWPCSSATTTSASPRISRTRRRARRKSGARASATRSRFLSRCPSSRRCGGRRSTPAPCRSPGASGRAPSPSAGTCASMPPCATGSRPSTIEVHQVLTFELGAAVSFASPGH